MKPGRPHAEEVEVTSPTAAESGEEHWKREKNVIDAIREGKPANCNVELAGPEQRQPVIRI